MSLIRLSLYELTLIFDEVGQSSITHVMAGCPEFRMTAKSYSTAVRSCDRRQPARTPPSTFLFLLFNLSNSCGARLPPYLRCRGRRVILRLLNRRLHNNQVVRSVGDASSIHQLAAAARRRWAVYRGQPLLVSTPSNLKNEAPVTLWRTYPAIWTDLRKNNGLWPVHNHAAAAVGAAGGHPAG